MGIKNGIRIVPVLLAVALAACGDSSGPGGVNTTCGLAGSSTGTVTGVVTPSLNGCAIFSVSNSSNITTIGITAGTASSPTHVLGMGRDGGRPPVASYTIGAGATQFAGGFTFDGGSSADRTFVLSGGTVNITASSASGLSGTLISVTAFEANTPGNTITISGNFTAKCVVISGTSC